MLSTEYRFKVLWLPALCLAFTLAGCCDCDCPLDPREFDSIVCNPFEATISEFSPELVASLDTDNDIVLTPGDRYAIHSFQFPINDSESGRLINRQSIVRNGAVIVEFDEVMPPSTNRCIVAYTSNAPSNEGMVGDILIEEIDLTSTPPTACLRFGGRLARISPDINTESARDFCNYLQAIAAIGQIGMAAGEATDFGEGIQANTIRSASIETSNTVTLDENFILKIPQVGDLPFLNAQRLDLVARMQASNNYSAICVEVEIGQVFYYEAKSGRAFVFAVVEMDEGDLPPGKNRLTIIFNEV